MNRRDEVIRMVLEAGVQVEFTMYPSGPIGAFTPDEIGQLIDSAATAERNRCHAIVSAPHWKPAVRAELAKRAAAIRALKDGEE